MRQIRFLQWGRWILGGAAATSVSIGVAYCAQPMGSSSGSSWTPTRPANVAEGYHSKWDFNWDKREPYSLVKPPKRGLHSAKSPDEEIKEEEKLLDKMEKKKAKVLRHLILIRHGQYNMTGDKDKDRYLTELGREQATATGERLRKSGINFDSIISSNMTRAVETTEIIMKELNQEGLCYEVKDPILREGSPCLPEPAVSSWKPDQYYFEDGPRIEAAFRKYFHRAEPEQEKDSFEIIVCHANVIRFFICRALQFPAEAWLRISLNNCSVSVVTIGPTGRVILRSLGDSGHLPADKTTRT